MNDPPPIGFFGRTFGWTGSRRECLTLLIVAAWLAVGYAIGHYSQRWTLGETLLAGSLWVLTLLFAARDAVRNLFGPVFFYDIVRVGRQRLTFVLRWLYVAVIGLTLGLMYWSWLEFRAHPNARIVGTGELASFGTEFFQTFASIQFIVVLFLTPVYVAGTIVVEKERKTLEFLLATDLRNREIIFGKLASRVTNLLMYVFAGLPVLAFAQLFGGIDPELVLASFVATVTTCIGLSALSLWFSTFMRKARDAIMLTYLTFVVYIIASFFAAVYSNLAPWKGWWNADVEFLGFTLGFHDLLRWSAEGNIGWHLLTTQMPRGPMTATPVALRSYVIWWAVVSILLLGHAILRLRTVALSQAYGPEKGTRSRKKKVATVEGQKQFLVNEAVRQHPEMGDNPVLWKELFVDSGLRGGCIGRIVAALVLLLIFTPFLMILWFAFIESPSYRTRLTFPQLWWEFQQEINGWVRGATGVLSGLMFFSVAIRAAGAISGEKDKDSWISLLATPLSSEEILSGKWWGCLFSVRRVIFVMLVIWSIGLCVGAVHPLMIIVTAAAIFLFLSAFSWLGLFCSMTARNTMIASVRAFFVSFFLMGGYWIVIGVCCAMPMALMQVRNTGMFEPIGQLLGALSPPFLSGWLPLYFPERSYSHIQAGDRIGLQRERERDYEPFVNDQHGIGLAAPIIAFLIWLAFTLFLRYICRAKFRKVTNGEAMELPDVPPSPTLSIRYE